MDMHNHHAQPIIELNETDILLHHPPTPPSYWSLDIDNIQPDEKRYPTLMALHVFFMSAAFFGALPAGESSFPILLSGAAYLGNVHISHAFV